MNTLHREHGRVVSVSENPLGSELLADTPNGSTTLAVKDAVDFNPAGGWLLINTQVIGYSAADYTTDTLTLLSPLAISANAGDRVDSYSLDASSAFSRRVASVDPDDEEGSADTIEAVVPHALFDRLAAKIRDLGGESVEIEETSPGQWRVVDVVAQQPSADGKYVWNPYAFADIATANAPNSTYTQITAWQRSESVAVDTTAGYKILYPGVYAISAQVPFASNVNGRRRARILLNGDTTNPVLFRSVSPDPGVVDYVGFARDIRLLENDVITMEVWQDSGATLTFGAAAGSGNFSLHRVSV